MNYYERLSTALRDAGVFQPTLLIDLDRLDANIELLKASLPGGMAFRIVAKSLPCSPLLRYICSRTGTNRFMTFNLPMLLTLAHTEPDADQLLGKPLPAAALRRFLDRAPLQSKARVRWLVDTPARLSQYQEVSEALDEPLRIVLELDVGLHRGGFEPGEALKRVMTQLRDSNRLRFDGFMGYEAHVGAMPKALGVQERAMKAAWAIYAEALTLAQAVFGEDYTQTLLRNAAGSPTFRLYEDTGIANEVSVGSALVKPAHFDKELLAPFQPAAFIATPVLKATGKTRLPGLEFAGGAARAIEPDKAQTFFIHGGNWMADPVNPPGLSYNKMFGRSSNQEMLNGPAELSLAPDDFVFLRPHQSEAVFLQFGDIAAVRGDKIVEWWPTFPVSA